MSESIWKNYFEDTKDYPPRPLLVKTLPYVKERGEALDIGSGALNESRFLLSEGFDRVTAIDKEPIAQEITETLPIEKFAYVQSTFESFDFPVSTFDLINAQYSLAFIAPAAFNEVFKKIVASLKTGGVFTGNFFGKKDGWALDKEKTFHSIEEVKELLAGLEIIDFQEKEWDGETASGEMKHWHTFNFIVRKSK